MKSREIRCHPYEVRRLWFRLVHLVLFIVDSSSGIITVRLFYERKGMRMKAPGKA